MCTASGPTTVKAQKCSRETKIIIKVYTDSNVVTLFIAHGYEPRTKMFRAKPRQHTRYTLNLIFLSLLFLNILCTCIGKDDDFVDDQLVCFKKVKADDLWQA